VGNTPIFDVESVTTFDVILTDVDTFRLVDMLIAAILRFRVTTAAAGCLVPPRTRQTKRESKITMVDFIVAQGYRKAMG
jgi:hypothetical protein